MADESDDFEVWATFANGVEDERLGRFPNQEAAFLSGGLFLKNLGAQAIGAENTFDFQDSVGILLSSPGIPCRVIVKGAFLTVGAGDNAEPMQEGIRTELVASGEGVPE